jgi:hypothetical protein
MLLEQSLQEQFKFLNQSYNRTWRQSNIRPFFFRQAEYTVETTITLVVSLKI